MILGDSGLFSVAWEAMSQDKHMMTSFCMHDQGGRDVARPVPCQITRTQPRPHMGFGERKANYRKHKKKHILNTYVFPPAVPFLLGYTCAFPIFARKYTRDVVDHYGNTSRTITILLCWNLRGNAYETQSCYPRQWWEMHTCSNYSCCSLMETHARFCVDTMFL